MYLLGIDFGTSFTKAAVYEIGTDNYYPVPLCDVGANRKDRSIPSVAYISQDGQDVTIGDEAVNSKRDINNFFYNFKPELDTINEAEEEYQNKIKKIIESFFKYIKYQAEKRFIQKFDKVVITIPASAPKGGVRYNLMLNSAKKIGFNDVLIIPEPVAAAFYLLGDRIHSKEMNEKLFLIYDFGGGTFDTSIIKVNDEQIQVIGESVGSDNEQKWGGIYIDSKISIDYITKSDYAKRQVAIISDGTCSIEQKLYASEHLTELPIRVKIGLSKKETYTTPSLYSYSLSRKDFEEMIKEMVNNTIETTLSLLDRANKEKLCENIHSINKVFLIGGSSQIPLVNSRWKYYRKAHNANFEIEIKPELNIIALGAARYRDLRLSPQQLNERGKKLALSENYKKAAAYFNNAGDGEGIYFLGVLYYLGVIGRKRQLAKAYKLFERSNYPESFLMMALMSFNNDGVLKNDETAIKMLAIYSEYLARRKKDNFKTISECQNLFTSLHNVLEGGRNPNDLNNIYQFNARFLLK